MVYHNVANEQIHRQYSTMDKVLLRPHCGSNFLHLVFGGTLKVAGYVYEDVDYPISDKVYQTWWHWSFLSNNDHFHCDNRLKVNTNHTYSHHLASKSLVAITSTYRWLDPHRFRWDQHKNRWVFWQSYCILAVSSNWASGNALYF